MCGSCDTQIRGPFITALGRTWCPLHFVCNMDSCKISLQDVGFVEEKGAYIAKSVTDGIWLQNAANVTERLLGTI